MAIRPKVPTLVELCTQTAINNLRYIGDVGELDLHLLKDILPHCTVDQLAHIENSTRGRDLSPVTDSLWKRFYGLQFGAESTNLVTERMKERHICFKWKRLYEAKTEEREKAQEKIGQKLKQRYAETLAKKQSRQIRICSKVPPSSNKRHFWAGSGSSSISGFKSPLMKKAKLECLNSPEARIHATMKRNAIQRKILPVKSAPHPTNRTSFRITDSTSNPKTTRPTAR